MTASPLTLLPDPAGTKPLPDTMWTYGITVDATASALAQTAVSRSVLTAGGAQTLYFYTRSGDRWTRRPAPDRVAGQGPPLNVTFSPDGGWLLVSCANDLTNAANDYRLYLYRRDGDTLSLVGKSPAGTEFLGVGYASNACLTFDPTGRYVLCCDIFGGYNGLLTVGGDGSITAGWQYTTGVWGSAAWNPADPAVFAAMDYSGGLTVYRIIDGEVVLIANPGGFYNSVQWHPSGRFILASGTTVCYSVAPMVVSYPEGYFWGSIPEFNYCITGYAIDPTGRYLAAGYLLETDIYTYPQVFGGLKIAGFDPDRVPGDTDYYLDPFPAYDVYDPVPAGQQVAGNLNVWGRDGDALYLVSSSFPGSPGNFDDTDSVYPSPWGFRTYRIGAGGATSTLWQRQPGGQFATVGVDTRPLAMITPDGTPRTWPDTSAPLLMNVDGVWRQVIG